MLFCSCLGCFSPSLLFHLVSQLAVDNCASFCKTVGISLYLNVLRTVTKYRFDKVVVVNFYFCSFSWWYVIGASSSVHWQVLNSTCPKTLLWTVHLWMFFCASMTGRKKKRKIRFKHFGQTQKQTREKKKEEIELFTETVDWRRRVGQEYMRSQRAHVSLNPHLKWTTCRATSHCMHVLTSHSNPISRKVWTESCLLRFILFFFIRDLRINNCLCVGILAYSSTSVAQWSIVDVVWFSWWCVVHYK